MASIRVIYRDGQLQPLDPLDLRDGQEVRIQILDERARVLDALSDLLSHADVGTADESNFDEDALQQEIDAAAQGVTLSDIIIEERRTGSQ